MPLTKANTDDAFTEEELRGLLVQSCSKISDQIVKLGFHSRAMVALLLDVVSQRLEVLNEVHNVLASDNPREFVLLLDFDMIHEYLVESDSCFTGTEKDLENRCEEMTIVQYFFECTSWSYCVPPGTTVEVQEFARREGLTKFIEAHRNAEDHYGTGLADDVFSVDEVVPKNADYYRKLRMLDRYNRVFSPESGRLLRELPATSVDELILQSVKSARDAYSRRRSATDWNDQSDAENLQALLNEYTARKNRGQRPILLTQTGPVSKAMQDIGISLGISEILTCSVRAAVCMHELGAVEDVRGASSRCRSLLSLWNSLQSKLVRLDYGRLGDDERGWRNRKFLAGEILRIFEELRDDPEKRQLEETLVSMTGAARVRGYFLQRIDSFASKTAAPEPYLEASRIVDVARSLMLQAPAPRSFTCELCEVSSPSGSFSRHRVLELTHGIAREPIINCSEFMPRLPGDKRRRMSYSWPVCCGLSRLWKGLVLTGLLPTNACGVLNGATDAIKLAKSLPPCESDVGRAFLSFDHATVEIPIKLLSGNLPDLLCSVQQTQVTESQSDYGWWRVGGDVGCLVIHTSGWEIRFEFKPLDAHHRRVMFIRGDSRPSDADIIAIMYDWTGGRFVYKQPLLECLRKLFS